MCPGIFETSIRIVLRYLLPLITRDVFLPELLLFLGRTPADEDKLPWLRKGCMSLLISVSMP